MIMSVDRSYSDELQRIAANIADPDINLEACSVAQRHGKTVAEVMTDANLLVPRVQVAINDEEPTQPIPNHDCKILTLADVTPRKVEWLWPGRIPLGMFSLLAGQPGVGKSTIAFSMAAIVSTGSTWPFTLEKATPGDVVILTAEDDMACTLSPRLIAAGADLSRIRVIESVSKFDDEREGDFPLLLSEDMRQLHGVLRQYSETRLLIFDPLSAYLGVKDSHRDADVRQVLGPLTEFASEHGVAVLGITHLSKNAAQNAIARFMGSTGIIAAARSAYLATRHDDDLMLLPVKSNVAPDSGGLTYRVVGKTIKGDIETAAIEWTGQTDMGADEVLKEQAEARRSPKLTEAVQFLEDQLRDGPKRQPEIEQDAKAAGISWATVRNAKDHLEIRSSKDRFSGGWKWYTAHQYANKVEVEGT